MGFLYQPFYFCSCRAHSGLHPAVNRFCQGSIYERENEQDRLARANHLDRIVRFLLHGHCIWWDLIRV